MPNLINPTPLHILMVEENAAAAALLTSRLTPLLGARITLVNSAESALDAVARKSFDLLLFDANLLTGAGRNLLARLRAHIPEIAVVVLGGNEDRVAAVNAMQAGAQDYLTRQEIEQYPPLLERAIRYAMERQRFLMTLAQVDELRGRERQLRRLNQMGELLHACLNTSEAQQIIHHAAESLFSPSRIRGAFGLLRGDGEVELVERWGELAGAPEVFEAQQCWGLRRGSLNTSGGGGQPTADCSHWPVESGAGLCIPLSTQGEVLGVLSLGTADAAAESLRELMPLAVTFAEHCSLAIANLRLRERMQREAIHDPLTGVLNRRYLQEALERELSRAERAQSPISLLMLDVNQFKLYNDTYGHLAGDQLLAEIGAYLQIQTRDGDLVCRYGGDEFVLVLPETTAEDARRCAEKLHAGAGQINAKERVKFSVGCASYPEEGSDVQNLLASADSALYAAKRAA